MVGVVLVGICGLLSVVLEKGIRLGAWLMDREDCVDDEAGDRPRGAC